MLTREENSIMWGSSESDKRNVSKTGCRKVYMQHSTDPVRSKTKKQLRSSRHRTVIIGDNNNILLKHHRLGTQREQGGKEWRLLQCKSVYMSIWVTVWCGRVKIRQSVESGSGRHWTSQESEWKQQINPTTFLQHFSHSLSLTHTPGSWTHYFGRVTLTVH